MVMDSRDCEPSSLNANHAGICVGSSLLSKSTNLRRNEDTIMILIIEKMLCDVYEI